MPTNGAEQGKRGWEVIQCPLLVTTIKLERFSKRGYEVMHSLYEKFVSHPYELQYKVPL
jgi:hypothetical protein